jgi:aspartate/methionine/tyrosine aminotransferase
MNYLPKLGFKNILRPDGAFYLYADISSFNVTSDILVRDILLKTGVAITPGIDFDKARGHNTVRFSFACSLKEVTKAMKRLTKWYQSDPKIKC